jgi:hypothetical protein
MVRRNAVECASTSGGRLVRPVAGPTRLQRSRPALDALAGRSLPMSRPRTYRARRRRSGGRDDPDLPPHHAARQLRAAGLPRRHLRSRHRGLGLRRRGGLALGRRVRPRRRIHHGRLRRRRRPHRRRHGRRPARQPAGAGDLRRADPRQRRRAAPEPRTQRPDRAGDGHRGGGRHEDGADGLGHRALRRQHGGRLWPRDERPQGHPARARQGGGRRDRAAQDRLRGRRVGAPAAALRPARRADRRRVARPHRGRARRAPGGHPRRRRQRDASGPRPVRGVARK